MHIISAGFLLRINDMGPPFAMYYAWHVKNVSNKMLFGSCLKNSNVKYIRDCLFVGVSPANRDGVAASVCGDLHRVVLRSARNNAGIPKPAYLLHTPPIRKHVNDTY